MIKMKKITKKTEIALHPLAKDAFTWLRECPFLVNHTKLSDELIHSLSKQPLFAVERQENVHKNQNSVLQIYAPLPCILFWQNSEPILGTKIIVDPNVTEHEIEEQAWLSALSSMFLSIDKTQSYFLRDSLAKYMPPRFHQAFFSKARFSYSEISMLIGCSKNALKQQKKRANENSTVGVLSKSSVINSLNEALEKLEVNDD